MPRKRKESSVEGNESVTQQMNVRTTDSINQNQGTKMSEDRSIIEFAEDLSDAEAPVPLPAGDYVAEIRGAEVKTSPKGNDYIAVQFYINPDDYPADYTQGNPDGTVLNYMRLSPENSVRARWNLKKFCEAIGYPPGKRVDLNEWVGKTALVTVRNEPYDGVMQANIAKINPA